MKPTKKLAAKKPLATKPRATKARRGTRRESVKRKTGSDASALLTQMRRICLALPQTKEVEAWGHPTFRVGEKIFATFGATPTETSPASIGVKTTHDMQTSLVSSDPRFTIAAYVGKHGWVTMALGKKIDWAEIDVLVRASYRLIAPAKLIAALDD